MSLYRSWLWPDRTIGKGESRQLRDEHNALVNSHAELLAICNEIFAHPKPFGGVTIDAKTVSKLWAAISKAEGRAS